MKRFWVILAIAIVVSALLIGGCTAPAPAPKPAPTPTPAPAPAPAPATPIKIGVVFPLTGSFAMTSAKMVKAAKFAMEEVNNEIAGRKIELIVEDTAGTAQGAIDKARKLAEFDKVAILIGPHTTQEKMAVAPIMSKLSVPEIFAVPSPWKIADYEWTFNAGGAEVLHPSAMAAYAYEKLGIKMVTAMGPDVVEGHNFLEAFKNALTKRGGQVVQEQYIPMGNKDFGSYFSVLKDANAVAAWFTGADAVLFHSQYDSFGIRKRMPLVAYFTGSFFQPFILNQLPPSASNAMIGEYCPTQWSPFLEDPVSKRFVEAYSKAQGPGYVPEEMESSVYTAAQVALLALKATGGDTTPEKIRQAIVGLKFDSPEGPIRFDPKTRFATRSILIAKIDKKDGKFVLTPIHTYKDIPPEGL